MYNYKKLLLVFVFFTININTLGSDVTDTITITDENIKKLNFPNQPRYEKLIKIILQKEKEFNDIDYWRKQHGATLEEAIYYSQKFRKILYYLVKNSTKDYNNYESQTAHKIMFDGDISLNLLHNVINENNKYEIFEQIKINSEDLDTFYLFQIVQFINNDKLFKNSIYKNNNLKESLQGKLGWMILKDYLNETKDLIIKKFKEELKNNDAENKVEENIKYYQKELAKEIKFIKKCYENPDKDSVVKPYHDLIKEEEDKLKKLKQEKEVIKNIIKVIKNNNGGEVAIAFAQQNLYIYYKDQEIAKIYWYDLKKQSRNKYVIENMLRKAHHTLVRTKNSLRSNVIIDYLSEVEERKEKVKFFNVPRAKLNDMAKRPNLEELLKESQYIIEQPLGKIRVNLGEIFNYSIKDKKDLKNNQENLEEENKKIKEYTDFLLMKTIKSNKVEVFKNICEFFNNSTIENEIKDEYKYLLETLKSGNEKNLRLEILVQFLQNPQLIKTIQSSLYETNTNGEKERKKLSDKFENNEIEKNNLFLDKKILDTLEISQDLTEENKNIYDLCHKNIEESVKEDIKIYNLNKQTSKNQSNNSNDNKNKSNDKKQVDDNQFKNKYDSTNNKTSTSYTEESSVSDNFTPYKPEKINRKVKYDIPLENVFIIILLLVAGGGGGIVAYDHYRKSKKQESLKTLANQNGTISNDSVINTENKSVIPATAAAA